jgi:hypothetical protein
MRSCLLGVLLLGLAGPPALAQSGKPPPFPQVGSDLPGPFFSYMATGKKKGKFHCLLTEHELNPTVMVLVRGAETTDPLKYLLVKLDNAIDRNPNTRLAGFAIFLSDGIKDLAGKDKDDDEAREEMEKKLEDIARDAGLKYVTLAIDLKERLERYKVGELDVVVILYNRYRVVRPRPEGRPAHGGEGEADPGRGGREARRQEVMPS